MLLSATSNTLHITPVSNVKFIDGLLNIRRIPDYRSVDDRIIKLTQRDVDVLIGKLIFLSLNDECDIRTNNDTLWMFRPSSCQKLRNIMKDYS